MGSRTKYAILSEPESKSVAEMSLVIQCAVREVGKYIIANARAKIQEIVATTGEQGSINKAQSRQTRMVASYDISSSSEEEMISLLLLRRAQESGLDSL